MQVARAVDLILAERQRQISEEGWTPEHDDGHDTGELAIRAAELAVADTDAELGAPDGLVPDLWGLVAKHGHDEVRALTIAGALIAAELDRVLRAKGGA